MSIYSIMPDAEILLSLDPEEVAGVILEHLNADPKHNRGDLNPNNLGLEHTVRQYPEEYHPRIRRALMEGWVWLEREGLIAPDPDQSPGWVFITRKGEQFKTATDVRVYREAARLPKSLLHETIVRKAWGLFLRGDYDTSVFQAFKEIEIAVRTACYYPADSLGENLMRRAFDAEKGPLRDPSLPVGERVAEVNLFAGAIGRFKNPQSHRNVALTDPVEAFEMLILAGHLMRIVDARSAAGAVVG